MILNASNNTTDKVENYILASVFGLLDILIICSNMFVIISLSHGNRARFTATRKLLINLAVADLCLGIFVLGPAIGNEIFHVSLTVGTFNFCRICLGLDVFFSTASTYSLAVIAVDRFLGVCFALRYNHLMSGYRTLSALLIPWNMAFILSLPVFTLFDFSLIMKSEGTVYYSFCSMRNSGTLLRIYQALLCWCIPASVSVYGYSKVCSRVIQNVRGQSTGIIQEKDEISRLKNSANAVTGQGAPKTSERPVSSMRIHIGGQPCYMKVNNEKSKKEESKMFSYIPGTVKCGFLIVAASLPKKMNESQIGSQKENEGDGTGTKTQCGETNYHGRHRSSTSLTVLPSSGTHLDVYDSRAIGRGGTAHSARSSADSQSSFFLKPSKWAYGRNITRKSDSEFSNLRSFRRCALMPIQPRVNRSVSGEIHENNLTVTASDAPQSVTTIPHSNTPSITCEAPQNQASVRIKRECKAVMQMLLNVLIYFVGWLPFFFVQILEIWSPKELIAYPVFAITFWARFCLTALNPFVVGYSSEELRKAFRSLIYCGHPKQEKKALKRLVLAGLGAAGIPYGRPIIPMRPHPVVERSSPSELT